jgi:hypothetical protein
VWVGPDSNGCYELQNWKRFFGITQFDICSDGKVTGTVLMLDLWYIKKIPTGHILCPDSEGVFPDVDDFPDDVPGGINPPGDPGEAPTDYDDGDSGGICFGHSLVCPPEDYSGKEPRAGEPGGGKPDDGWEDADSDAPKPYGAAARSILDSSKWIAQGDCIPYPPEDGVLPEVDECCVLVMEADGESNGKPKKSVPRHAARSNGKDEDGNDTFDSKDDSAAPVDPASFDEAFGPTFEYLKKTKQANICLRVYCPNPEMEDCCPDDEESVEIPEDL